MDLPEVRGKLGLLIFATRHILVWIYNLSPRLQAACDLAFYGSADGLTLFCPGLFVEADTEQLHLHFVDFISLGRGNSREEPPRRIQYSVSVIAGKGFLMCPLVTCTSQFTY